MRNKEGSWTVLVYMAGDNNLSEEMVYGLKEMKRIATQRGFGGRVIVQFDPRGSKPRVFDLTKPANPESDGDLESLGQPLTDDEISAIITSTPVFREMERPFRQLQQAVRKAYQPNLDALGERHGKGLPSGVAGILSFKPEEHRTFKTMKQVLANLEGHFNAEIEERKKALEATLDRLETLIIENSGAPEVVQHFIETHVDRAVRGYRMLVFSGHGSGAVGDFLSDDATPGASLSIPDLRKVIEQAIPRENGNEGPAIDIVGMDSCLMSMAEVAYELRNSARYLVGSEGFVNNAGWPYHRVLEEVQKNLDAKDPDVQKDPPKHLAEMLVRRYICHYKDYEIVDFSTDQAACDLKKMDALATKLKALVEILVPEEGRSKLHDPAIQDAILLAHWKAQSYKAQQYTDLWDFCEKLEKQCADVKLKQACEDVKHAVKKVAFFNCYSGGEFQHSHGLSVYFPWSQTLASQELSVYKGLEFARVTRWGDFLEKYLEETQQPRRNEKHKPKEIRRPDRPWDSVIIGRPLGGGIRLNPDVGTKLNPDVGTKLNPDVGTKFLAALAEGTKNPPDGYYPDDRCDCSVKK